MITINYWAVLTCAIISMALGFIWYGPLFGKKWLEITGATKADEATRAEMMKRANKLYAVQFLLSLFQVFVLAYYIASSTATSGISNALWIWAAFIMPTVAGSAMWNSDSAKVSWARFLIQAGYQLVLFALFGLILGLWR